MASTNRLYIYVCVYWFHFSGYIYIPSNPTRIFFLVLTRRIAYGFSFLSVVIDATYRNVHSINAPGCRSALSYSDNWNRGSVQIHEFVRIDSRWEFSSLKNPRFSYDVFHNALVIFHKVETGRDRMKGGRNCDYTRKCRAKLQVVNLEE